MGNLQTPKPKFHCDTVSEDFTPLGVTVNNKVKIILINRHCDKKDISTACSNETLEKYFTFLNKRNI